MAYAATAADDPITDDPITDDPITDDPITDDPSPTCQRLSRL